MDPALPLVSVVVACFDAGAMLRPAMLSIIEQSYPNIEIIFVNNNCTDGSAEVASELARTHTRPIHIVSCASHGANNARSHGYRWARGEYI